jgi:putative Mn2+ efflux pump MntP
MRSDIALGLVTFLMSVLGGIVSAIALEKMWQKWTYALMFIVLGVVGLYFVVKQSNETAVATGKMEASFGTLGDSLKETARLQGLNTRIARAAIKAERGY